MRIIGTPLEGKINDLYAAFSRYPRFSNQPRGCTHCVSIEEENEIKNIALRELTPDNFGHIAANICTETWGDVEDFKHFLPRILELSVLGEFILPQRWMVAKTLHRYGWMDWPEEERGSVENLFHTLWDYMLDSYTPTPSPWDEFEWDNAEFSGRLDYHEFKEWVQFLCEAWNGLPEFVTKWPTYKNLSSGLLLARFVGTLSTHVEDAIGADEADTVSNVEEWPVMGELLKFLIGDKVTDNLLRTRDGLEASDDYNSVVSDALEFIGELRGKIFVPH